MPPGIVADRWMAAIAPVQPELLDASTVRQVDVEDESVPAEDAGVRGSREPVLLGLRGRSVHTGIEEISSRVAALEVADETLTRSLTTASVEARAALKDLALKQQEVKRELVASNEKLANDAGNTRSELLSNIRDVDSKATASLAKLRKDFAEQSAKQEEALKDAKAESRQLIEAVDKTASGHRAVLEAQVKHLTEAVDSRVLDLNGKVQSREDEIMGRVNATTKELAARIQESRDALSSRLEDAHKALANTDTALDARIGALRTEMKASLQGASSELQKTTNETEAKLKAGLTLLRSEVGETKEALSFAKDALTDSIRAVEGRLDAKVVAAVAGRTSAISDHAKAAQMEAERARSDAAAVSSNLSAAIVAAKGDMLAGAERLADETRAAVADLKARVEGTAAEAKAASARTAADADGAVKALNIALLERIGETGAEATRALETLRAHVKDADAGLQAAVDRNAAAASTLSSHLSETRALAESNCAAIDKINVQALPAALARLEAARTELRGSMEAGDAGLREAAAAAAEAGRRADDEIRAALADARAEAAAGHKAQEASLDKLAQRADGLERLVGAAKSAMEAAGTEARAGAAAAKSYAEKAAGMAEAAREHADVRHAEALAHADKAAERSAGEMGTALRAELALVDKHAEQLATAARNDAVNAARGDVESFINGLGIPNQIAEAVNDIQSKIQHEVAGKCADREDLRAVAGRLEAAERGVAALPKTFPTREEVETRIEDAIERAIDGVMRHLRTASEGLAALQQRAEEADHRLDALESFAAETRASGATKSAVESVRARVGALEQFRADSAKAAYLTRADADESYAGKSAFALATGDLQCRVEDLESAVAGIARPPQAPARLESSLQQRTAAVEDKHGPIPPDSALIAAYLEAQVEGIGGLGYTLVEDGLASSEDGSSAVGGIDHVSDDHFGVEVATGVCGAVDEPIYAL